MATTRPLEDTEIQKLFANIAGRHVRRNRTMIWLGIAGALRATELVSLTVGDVYDGREVKTYLTIRGETAKFGKERIIRIGADVRQMLADFIRWKTEQKESLATDAPLFLSQKGGPLTRQMLHVILRRVFKQVGIDQSPTRFGRRGR
jgi:integrase/recombinase XerD